VDLTILFSKFFFSLTTTRFLADLMLGTFFLLSIKIDKFFSYFIIKKNACKLFLLEKQELFAAFANIFSRERRGGAAIWSLVI
jgi:hypothetical protein